MKSKNTPNIDEKDLKILRILQTDSRTPFLEIARKIGVSGATIHERVRALRESGVINGFSINLDYHHLGYDITAIVEVTLEHPVKTTDPLSVQLEKIPEVVEAHHMTGDTDMLLMIRARSIDELRDLLKEKLQHLPGVRRLSTSVVLDSPVMRQGPLF